VSIIKCNKIIIIGKWTTLKKRETQRYGLYRAPISRNGASLTCQSGRPGMADLQVSSGLLSGKLFSALRTQSLSTVAQAQAQKVCSTAVALRIYA